MLMKEISILQDVVADFLLDRVVNVATQIILFIVGKQPGTNTRASNLFSGAQDYTSRAHTTKIKDFESNADQGFYKRSNKKDDTSPDNR